MSTISGLTAEESLTRLAEKLDITAVVPGDGIDVNYNGTTNQLTIASAGGSGGGMSSVFGARRMQCTTFTSFYISTGTGKTIVEPSGWTDMGPILTDSTYDPQAPVLLVAGDGTAFDTQDAGIYAVRYSVNIDFADDAGTPPWVTYNASEYFQNRPHSHIVPTIPFAERSARYYGTNPGTYFDAYLPPHQRIDWDPSDGSYYLNIILQWPGNIAASTTTMNIMADIIRLG